MSIFDRPRALIDFETRSKAKLVGATGVGAWAYSEDPSTSVLCMGYKMAGERTALWIPEDSEYEGGTPFPEDLSLFIKDGGVVEAHGAQFERSIFKNVMGPKYGTPLPTRWMDTMATCAYRSIPLGLDQAGRVLNADILKDKRGKYLIQQLCTPKKPIKADPNREWLHSPELFKELCEYCIRDVDAEFVLGEMLGDLPISEYRLWVLDQIINYRGIYVDVESALNAIDIMNGVEKELTTNLRTLTDGFIQTGGQATKFKEWMRDAELIDMPDTKAETVAALLETDIEPSARAVLELRQKLSKSSTKKLNKLISCANRDGKLRGLLQYHGAGTGRWAGRLVQPHNLPRGTVSNKFKGDASWCDMDLLIDHINTRDPELLDILYGSCMDAISSSIRGMLTASPGKTLMVADFAGIEARVVMWLAGEEEALEAFRKYDRKEGPDIYCVMAEKLYNKPINKTDHPDERAFGKVTILGCGYQMGAVALQAQASDMYGLEITLKTAKWLVDTFREGYSKVANLWKGFNDAAIEAVRTGRRVSYGLVSFEVVDDAAGKWMAITLPNQRKLWYYNPNVELVTPPWERDKEKEQDRQRRNGEPVTGGNIWKIMNVTYEGKNNKKSGVWGTVRTYGGMLTENIVQAIARDLMAEAMIRVEREKYPIILTVHDEIISEVDIDYGSLGEFCDLMSGPIPDWAAGCPISVDGWGGKRYRK